MDALLVDGDLTPRGRLVTGDDATLQRVRLRLGLFAGEWILDQTVGIPWIPWMERKMALRLGEIGAVLRAAIETTPGVNRVLGWSSAYDTSARRATFTGRFLLDSGTVVEGVIAPDPTTPITGYGWLSVIFY